MAPTKDLAAIRERLLGVCQPKSVRARVESLTFDFFPFGPARILECRSKEEYAATSSGRYFFDRIRIPDGEPWNRDTHFSNGLDFAHVGYYPEAGEPSNQSRVSIDKQDPLRGGTGSADVYAPHVFRLYFIGKEPLHEALSKAKVMPDGEVIGRDCDVPRFRSGPGPSYQPKSLVYFLDKSTSVPLRVSAYDALEPSEGEAPRWVWEAKTLDRVSQGHFLPLASTLTTYGRHDAGGGKSETKVRVVEDIRIVHAEFDTPIPATRFWPVIQPGTPVHDGTQPSPPSVSPGMPMTLAEVESPIRADILLQDAHFMTMVGSVFGVAIFLVAFLLRKWTRY